MRPAKKVTAGSDTGKRVLLSDQRVSLSGVTNARELGGYGNTDNKEIKRGRLIRSGSLYPATTEDKRMLSELYRVGTVIDFRTPREAAEKPDPALAARYYNLPVLDSSEGTGTAGLYLKMLFDEGARRAYKRFFELLLASDVKQAVLFHSERGNDRTGVAAALLLTVLGVPEDIVTEDYLLSNKAYERAEPSDITISPTVYAHSLDYAFTTAKIEYGSVISYINNEIGLNNKDIGELRHKYLSE
mgnify:CR=1 FL=1